MLAKSKIKLKVAPEFLFVFFFLCHVAILTQNLEVVLAFYRLNIFENLISTISSKPWQNAEKSFEEKFPTRHNRSENFTFSQFIILLPQFLYEIKKLNTFLSSI